MRKTTLLSLAGMLLAALLYLLTWPVPVDPVVWHPPSDAGYTGAFAPNERLKGLNRISLDHDGIKEEGPEHIVIGPDGLLYTTVASGRILRMQPDGTQVQSFAETGGRVLGFDFDREGNLIAADAERGLLSIDRAGVVTVLTDHVGSSPIIYADAVIVAADGRMYFTDASTRFGAKQWGGTFEASVLDILEQSATGRVLVYDPALKTTEIVAKGISFANGIALSSDGRALFVAETGRYRIWWIDASVRDLNLSTVAAESSQAGILIDNLPGYPDNLMRGKEGRIWVGLVKPRNPTVDAMAEKPFLRRLTLRLPRSMWPVPVPYGHVVAFLEDGTIVASLQDPTGAYPETTAITETEDRLYVQSLHAPDLGWLPAEALRR
ncbi:MAG: SMP-30/gluconolactonase/LRE family protein [Leptonema illini]|uniref:SMP-30/gluconolactonase/LRE family protein n=1 Tax=Leptonema illini TaxID=183 RepID=A0A833H2N8_9LEPT|nr:MAG: SMP-30/gluconolactonase/LRE family protein [Leptonema illini]